MKPSSILRLKHVAWTSAGMMALVAVVFFFAGHSGAKPTTQTPPPPVVEVAPVNQKDVPIYSEWIGTLTGQVNADIKAQVTGYLLRQNYKEGSYVTKGQLLFEIDPRTFQAALDQAKGQLAQAEAQLVLGEAQLAADQYQAARTIYTKQVGPEHPYTLRTTINLALSYYALGRNAEALKLNEETLSQAHDVLGPLA